MEPERLHGKYDAPDSDIGGGRLIFLRKLILWVLFSSVVELYASGDSKPLKLKEKEDSAAVADVSSLETWVRVDKGAKVFQAPGAGGLEWARVRFRSTVDTVSGDTLEDPKSLAGK